MWSKKVSEALSTLSQAYQNIDIDNLYTVVDYSILDALAEMFETFAYEVLEGDLSTDQVSFIEFDVPGPGHCRQRINLTDDSYIISEDLDIGEGDYWFALRYAQWIEDILGDSCWEDLL